jgi:hypothetical protein
MKITHIIGTIAGIYKDHCSLSWLAAWLHSFVALSVSVIDSRDIKHHYIKKQWPGRESLIQ